MLDKIALEAVGVEDAARAMILAAEHGRAPQRTVPVPVLNAMGAMGSAKARLRGSDERLKAAGAVN